MIDLPMTLTTEQKQRLDNWLSDPATPWRYKELAEANKKLARKINEIALWARGIQ